jgi:hypothetical protein
MVKIIKTENYLFVVDNESEIKEGQRGLSINDAVYTHHNHLGKDYGKKIISHLPLNNAPTLEGVPLLPPLEDEVEKLEMEYFIELEKRREVAKNFTGQVAGRHPDAFGHSEMIYMNRGYIEGYNKAKEKHKYTEEDLRKSVAYAISHKHIKGDILINKIIQSLQQPKYPVSFESAMELCEESCKNDWCKHRGCQNPIHGDSIKTIINSQGLTQLVGKYIY